MVLAKHSFVFLLFATVGVALARGCGPRPCSWRTCSASYEPHFSPDPPQGGCITQVRRVHHNYVTHNGQGNCPESTSCGEGDIVRPWCSCPIITCNQGDWGPWQQLSATQEFRDRVVHRSVGYNHQSPPCPGLPGSCTPARDVRPIEIRCPSVPAPDFGVLVGESCAGGASSYLDAKCRLVCNNGKVLRGNDVITCAVGNRWSGNIGRCEIVS